MSAEPAPPAVAPAGDGPAAVFAARAGLVGTDVRSAPRAALATVAPAILRGAGATRIVLDSAVSAAFPELAAALSDAGLGLAAPDAPPAELAALDAGLSLAAAGIVETGSLVSTVTPLGDRLAGMLPPVHVVLLRESDLLPDLDAAADLLRDWTTARPPRPYVSLITGPSRTADIERVLTIGVQGPCALHVVLVAGT